MHPFRAILSEPRRSTHRRQRPRFALPAPTTGRDSAGMRPDPAPPPTQQESAPRTSPHCAGSRYPSTERSMAPRSISTASRRGAARTTSSLSRPRTGKHWPSTPPMAPFSGVSRQVGTIRGRGPVKSRPRRRSRTPVGSSSTPLHRTDASRSSRSPTATPCGTRPSRGSRRARRSRRL